MASLVSLVVSPERLKRRMVLAADRMVPARRRRLEQRRDLYRRSGSLIDFSAGPRTTADERIREAAELLRPVTTSDLRLIRVGGDTDGGYIMMDPLIAEGALSIGVGPDISWDIDVVGRGIPVVMFDPTIRRPPAHLPGATFHRIGIGGADEGDLLTLPRLRELAGFGADQDLVLSMDVEGAEWESLRAAGSDSLRQYTQVTLELHGLDALEDEAGAQLVLDVLGILNAHHKPVYVHGNNHDQLVNFGRYWFPRTLEATFVRDDLIPDWEEAPHVDGWGSPNDQRLPDIRMEGLTAVRRSH